MIPKVSKIEKICNIPNFTNSARDSIHNTIQGKIAIQTLMELVLILRKNSVIMSQELCLQ